MDRLAGHRLESRGAPYTSHSCQSWPCDTIAGVQRVNRAGVALSPDADIKVAGFGHALCECGQTGPHQMSGAERRRWHSDHKNRLQSRSVA